MRSRNIILVILFIFMTTTLSAQKLTMGYLYPAGGEVGTTVEIEAGGLNIDKATKVLFSHPGIKGEVFPVKEKASAKRKRKRLTDQSSPQLADKINIKITIADNVPCGLYDLRLQGPKGVSNMLPFEVASYPNFVEGATSTLRKPNRVKSLPAVLCGYVSPGGIDYFKFSGKRGETIVASVKGRALVPYIADAVPGWFQPVIKIVDSKGREIAYSDDYHHHVDPVIITTLPKDGDYTLMIHDAIYRGREDFNYRVQLGVIPFVTGRYPAYGVVGKRVKQRIEGVNLGTTKATVKVKKEGYNQVTFTNSIGTSNAVPFYALPKGIRLLNSPKDGAELMLTNAITDSLTAKSKIKRYKIYAEAGEQVIVELIGRRNDSRIDAVLRLRNAQGRIVAEADDTEDPTRGLMTFHADPILKYKARRNEMMTLEVEDIHRGYGKDYHFLLRRHEQLPSFNAFVSPANITIPSGGTSMFNIDIKGKLKRPAHIEVEGLPKGYTTSTTKLLRGKKWNVSITAPKGAEVKRFPIEVKLNYPGPSGRERTNVLPVDKMMQAFYYTHYIQAAELALDVTESSPYRLSLDFDINQEIPLTFQTDSIKVRVLIDKNPGFDEPVELMLGNKTRLFSLEPISIMPEEREKTIYIKLNEAALEKLKSRKGRPLWQMYIVGTVKGEIIQRGRRRFQNAKYREMTPIFIIRLKK
ncbi:MAG: hypothetical protein E7140_02035 [Rikenellaceae bacterium]|nr:hypothetical protein [Rikenellaceae bacterium]